MLTLIGNKHRYRDRISRRSFLRIGGLAMGGLSLPGLLQAEQNSGRSSHKAVIMVYLSGGLSHHDSFDLKPDAPREMGVQIGATDLLHETRVLFSEAFLDLFEDALLVVAEGHLPYLGGRGVGRLHPIIRTAA